MTGPDDNDEGAMPAEEVQPEPTSPPPFGAPPAPELDVPPPPFGAPPAPEEPAVGGEPASAEAETRPGAAPSPEEPVPPVLEPSAEEPEPVLQPAPEEPAPVAATPRPRPATRRVTTRATSRKTPTVASTARTTAAPLVTAAVGPVRPTTLAIDVGGSGLKASVLDAAGKLVADRVRVVTPHPCPPAVLIDTLATLVAPLPSFDRVSAGFPGVVRKGVVFTAPHLVTRTTTGGSQVVRKLVTAWRGFDLAAGLSARFDRPVRVLNDADLQGLDVVSGSGLEFVLTLGTGVGSALFLDGRLAPHLELSHHPFRRGQTYDEQLGDAALRQIGARKWRKRLDEAFANFCRLLNYDKLYIGGGNSRLLVGHLDPSVTIVDNLAGILGGIKLWELPEN
jgi:polyphosphate glucokinase